MSTHRAEHDKPDAEDDRSGVAAVDRALTILAALVQAAEPLTLAALARDTGYYKSTLLRLIASLERTGLVMRRADQRYALGPFAFRLGQAFEATFHLKDAVLPVLRWLIAQGSESASFHVWQDDKTRLCLLRIDSNHPTLDRIRPGDLLPIRRGAAGKLLRAWRSASAEMNVSLVHTSFGERDPACAAVAAPVFGPNGELLGALSLSGPKERFSDAAVKKMSSMLLVAGKRATAALGGQWPLARTRHRQIARA
ncbi:MAG: IclR family transcriptional regulator [Burkholderiales bacterium]